MSERVKGWTPGLWEVVGDDDAPWGVVMVCSHRFIRPEGRSFNEARANANLVAAAPALVEALEDLLASNGGGHKSCGHDFSCVCAEDRAKEALKLVYGEAK